MTQNEFSRRSLIGGAAALAAARAIPVRAERDDDNSHNSPTLAYVGAYTPNSTGFYLFQVNPSSGKLTQLKIFPTTTNPSWLTFDPQKKNLYVVNEISNFNGGTTGSVSAYAIDKPTGNLTFLNTVSSGGAGPAHASVDNSGKFVFVANYGGGSVAVLPILSGGALANASDVKLDISACSPACPVGPTHAAKAPPGSFAISGHDAPHAHMIHSDPTGNFVVVNDLGLDLTIIWAFDKVNGKLSSPKTFPTSAGAGPRHFVFHPNGHWFYSLNEEASTLAFSTYDGHGTLTPIAEISTLPPGFVGTSFTSEIVMSSDGKFLYAANRLHDSIAVFSIGGNGVPEFLSTTQTHGDYPRSFGIEPSGNFLYSCNQRSDAITAFSLNGNGSKLTFTGQYTPVGSPAIIIFLG
jgi:6-phosphogluconolactonase